MKKLLFYYPQHFNRSKNGTNPFFDELMNACDNHGVYYDLMEEPDGGTDKPRNPRARKGDVFFWMVTCIRKILSLILPKHDFYKRERIAARVINFLTLGRYRYENYVTITGSMYHLFVNLNDKANVFDLQHGVLFGGQRTFFDENGFLRYQFVNRRLKILFWGKGYEKSFISGNEEALEGQTHVIGYPIAGRKVYLDNIASTEKEPLIVVSLQFTQDASIEARVRDKEILRQFLLKVHCRDIKVLLKHHPRFNNAIDLGDIIEQFDNISITNLTLQELTDKATLHVTFFSTAAFEYAEYGIPTFFLKNEDNSMADKLFYSQYKYPLYAGMDIDEVLDRLSDRRQYLEDGQAVKVWYSHFYSPFDEQAFLDLLKG